MDTFKPAIKSVWHFISLISHSQLRRSKDRLGRNYNFKEIGEYRIFRETVSLDRLKGERVVLVVGFRLKLLGRSSILHAIFQKVCILTTPFWSGFAGFHIKLWLVQPRTGNYLGVYDWVDKEAAENYVNWLVKILKPLSEPDTVWYQINSQDFEKYLELYEYRLP